MRGSRAKNSKRNLISGLIFQAINIIMPFIVRTLILYKLGEEYQGLNGLFTSLLSVLNMTELGFSSAVVYILYKPIAEGDNAAICSIMAYYKRVYRVIGSVILTIGLILLPVLPFLIKDTYPENINVYFLYLIYLINSVISYFFFAYKSALLSAMQRVDLVNKALTITRLLMYITQIIVLLTIKNFYVYSILLPVFTVINNLLLQVFSKKRFPQVIPVGEISNDTKKTLISQVKGVSFNKIGDAARNSFDSVILSALIGLSAVAVYNNYFYIYSALYAVSLTVSNCMNASVGNSIATESVEKNYKDLRKFTFIFTWFTGCCTACLCCLYQPFMKIWMNGNNNLMLSNFNMFLFCIYFYFITINNVRNPYVNGTGIYWELRWHYLAEAIGNIVLNFVLGYSLGITGILLATIITIFLFNFLSRNSVLFKFYFKRSFKEYYIDHILYFFVTFISCAITYFACSFVHVDGLSGLAIKLIIGSILPNIIYFVVYCKTKRFKEAFNFIKMVFLKIR